ncbi:MAG: TM2 domain-containing protein [Verrucomicrobiales bacterium]|nr:TM2 domain-containing protein [Verrucomicrobiales bacterium]
MEPEDVPQPAIAADIPGNHARNRRLETDPEEEVFMGIVRGRQRAHPSCKTQFQTVRISSPPPFVVQPSGCSPAQLPPLAHPNHRLKPALSRSKTLASLLAEIFGGFGAHWFHLRRRRRGWIHLVLFPCGSFFAGIWDAVHFIWMDRQRFEALTPVAAPPLLTPPPLPRGEQGDRRSGPVRRVRDDGGLRADPGSGLVGSRRSP